eukprot:NODE_4931_length_1830_cov_4.429830.p1 GENE.NODE_4931_length_1830_cov_4.429830~~NODE_4931_length_1830_cov_4.429830.p1  ORF type:complete len:498 (+),score=110.10 NODE_4931_length_1830_cov_4.429830:90-1583(+)
MELFSFLLGLLLGSAAALAVTVYMLGGNLRHVFAPGHAATPREVKAAPSPPKMSVSLSENYSPQHHYAVAAQAALKLITTDANEAENLWTPIVADNRSTEGAKMFTKDVPAEPVPHVRGDIRIEAPPESLVQLLLDPDHASTINPSSTGNVVVERLDAQTDVVYFIILGLGPVANREFYCCRTVQRLPEGLCISLVSIDHPGCPAVEVRGSVRATASFIGWLLRPTTEGAVNVTFVAATNANGSIPKSILRKKVNESAFCVRNLKRLASSFTFGGEEENLKQILTDHAQAAVDKLEAELQQGGWRSVATTNDVEIFRKDGAIQRIKGEGTIPAEVPLIRTALLDVALQKSFDPLCKEARVVANIDETTRVVYLRHQTGKLMLKTVRDFCVVARHKTLDDGTFLYAATSVEHPKCPVQTDTVRGDVKCSGWVVKPTNDANVAKTYYLAQVDLRGGISKKLSDMVARREPLIIHNLREFLIKSRGRGNARAAHNRSSTR